jgi:hypothetical protein
MTYPPYMREKARKLRRAKELTIDEIVLTVRSADTILRTRLQGWIDRIQEAWLDSPHGA